MPRTRWFPHFSTVILGGILATTGCGNRNPVSSTQVQQTKTISIPSVTIASGTLLAWVSGGDRNFAGHAELKAEAFIRANSGTVTLNFFVDGKENVPDWTYGRYPPAPGTWAEVVVYAAESGWAIQSTTARAE